jgi:hypothetical protein
LHEASVHLRHILERGRLEYTDSVAARVLCSPDVAVRDVDVRVWVGKRWVGEENLRGGERGVRRAVRGQRGDIEENGGSAVWVGGDFLFCEGVGGFVDDEEGVV